MVIYMTENRYSYSPHCVYNLGYNIWRPKYRCKIIVDGIDERFLSCGA